MHLEWDGVEKSLSPLLKFRVWEEYEAQKN